MDFCVAKYNYFFPKNMVRKIELTKSVKSNEETIFLNIFPLLGLEKWFLRHPKMKDWLLWLQVSFLKLFLIHKQNKNQTKINLSVDQETKDNNLYPMSLAPSTQAKNVKCPSET